MTKAYQQAVVSQEEMMLKGKEVQQIHNKYSGRKVSRTGATEYGTGRYKQTLKHRHARNDRNHSGQIEVEQKTWYQVEH